jgi:hypothetical protein
MHFSGNVEAHALSRALDMRYIWLTADIKLLD